LSDICIYVYIWFIRFRHLVNGGYCNVKCNLWPPLDYLMSHNFHLPQTQNLKTTEFEVHIFHRNRLAFFLASALALASACAICFINFHLAEIIKWKRRCGRRLSILSPTLCAEFGVADLIYVSFFTPRPGRLAIAKGAPDALSTSTYPYICMHIKIYICGWHRVGFYVPINMQNLCGCCCRFPDLAAQNKNSEQNGPKKFELFTWLTNWNLRWGKRFSYF